MLPLVGTAGFILIEEWNFLDSLYMSIITLTTVGFNEVQPLSPTGRWFVIIYLICGLGVFLFGVVQFGEAILRGQLQDLIGSRRMSTALKSLENHLVICGFGRMGLQLARHLAKEGKPFVVIDRDRESLAEAEREGWHFVVGDATDDRVLQAAHVDRGRGLATVLSNDADNLYVVLSARLMHPGLQILARATDEKSTEKMQRAGASHVINIYEAGASKMAHMLTNANLEDFIELLATPDNELDLAQFTVPEQADYIGKTLAESGFRDKDVMIVGICKPGGEFQIPPSSSAPIQAGDTLIALGKSDDLEDFLS